MGGSSVARGDSERELRWSSSASCSPKTARRKGGSTRQQVPDDATGTVNVRLRIAETVARAQAQAAQAQAQLAQTQSTLLLTQTDTETQAQQQQTEPPATSGGLASTVRAWRPSAANVSETALALALEMEERLDHDPASLSQSAPTSPPSPWGAQSSPAALSSAGDGALRGSPLSLEPLRRTQRSPERDPGMEYNHNHNDSHNDNDNSAVRRSRSQPASASGRQQLPQDEDAAGGHSHGRGRRRLPPTPASKRLSLPLPPPSPSLSPLSREGQSSPVCLGLDANERQEDMAMPVATSASEVLLASRLASHLASYAGVQRSVQRASPPAPSSPPPLGTPRFNVSVSGNVSLGQPLLDAADLTVPASDPGFSWALARSRGPARARLGPAADAAAVDNDGGADTNDIDDDNESSALPHGWRALLQLRLAELVQAERDSVAQETWGYTRKHSAGTDTPPRSPSPPGGALRAAHRTRAPALLPLVAPGSGGTASPRPSMGTVSSSPRPGNRSPRASMGATPMRQNNSLTMLPGLSRRQETESEPGAEGTRRNSTGNVSTAVRRAMEELGLSMSSPQSLL